MQVCVDAVDRPVRLCYSLPSPGLCPPFTPPFTRPTNTPRHPQKVHRPGGFTSQLLRTSGLRAPLLVKGDASALIPPLGVCLPEDYDIEHRATDATENDDRTVGLRVRGRVCDDMRLWVWIVLGRRRRGTAAGLQESSAVLADPLASITIPATPNRANRPRQVFTWDVARQEYGPAWSVAQWALYWRVRKGFVGKPTAQDVAVGLPPGVGPESSDGSDGGEEVDSKFVKKG